MAIGDQADFVARLRGMLPTRWFPSSAPVLDAVLSGLAASWSVCWDNLQFLRTQTRVKTANGEWLDAIAWDFLGNRLQRDSDESDDLFRARILQELWRVRGTRAAMEETLVALAGNTASIFEPMDVRDTGAYGNRGSTCGLFYMNVSAPAQASREGGRGGYGSSQRPMQAFGTIKVLTGTAQKDIAKSVAGVMPCTGIAWLDLQG